MGLRGTGHEIVTLVMAGVLAVTLFLWLAQPCGAAHDRTEAAALAHGARIETPAASETNMVNVKVFNANGKLVGPFEMPEVVKTDEQWQEQLPQDVYMIARNKGTEPPFCGTLLENHQQGVYSCICCGLPLFSSNAKFNSGTGWPSFFQPIAPENVTEHADRSHGMVRTEILCARCDCHLGHVFEDGPRPTGLRYCLNSASLAFTPMDRVAELADPAAETHG